jgi:hypothetical protein
VEAAIDEASESEEGSESRDEEEIMDDHEDEEDVSNESECSDEDADDEGEYSEASPPHKPRQAVNKAKQLATCNRLMLKKGVVEKSLQKTDVYHYSKINKQQPHVSHTVRKVIL